MAAGVEADAARPPAFVDALRETLTQDARDEAIEDGLANAVFLGVTSVDLLVADRSRITGRPKALLRRDPIGEVRARWIDDERHGMRSRILVLEFPDRRWSLVATPWKRLIPDDAVRLVEALGVSARRVPRPEIDSTQG